MRRARRTLLPALLVLAAALPARGETRARGANLHAAIGSEVDAVPAMHMSWVRLDVVWSLVETANGVISWDDLDRMVQTHRSRGLNIYATIGSTPTWACRIGTPPVEGSCVPQEGTFGRFARALATRYKGAIAVYGIWNEPDEPSFWDGDAVAYVDSLLIPAATAIREADPFAKIAAPDLSGSWGGSVRPQSSFYDAIALRHAEDLVDIVSQHVYEETLAKGPDGILHKFFDGNILHRSLIYAIERSVLAGKEIWVTEFGFAGGGDSSGGDDVRRVYELFAPRPEVTVLFNYELIDCIGCSTPGLGLLRTDLSWKPGADQLARLFADLDPTPPAFRDRFDGPWSAIFWRWTFPDGGASIRDGHLANSVPNFRAKIADLTVTDFEISSTVRVTDILGNVLNGMGVLGRTQGVADGGETSGYLATLRSNGDAVLTCAKSGLNLVARTGRDPKAVSVRLALRGSGDRISVTVDGVEVLVARDATWTRGSVGLQNRALGWHDDVVVTTSPDQVVPPFDPVGTLAPYGPVQPRVH